MGKKRNVGEGEARSKMPISEDVIYKITLGVTFGVAAVFFLKNLISANWGGAIAVGAVLAVFGLAILLMKKFKVKNDVKYLAVGAGLIITISLISLMSGESFSDDFLLYLAAMALTGMYFNPRYPTVQWIMSDVVLVVLYIVSPEKGGALGQYILCAVVFNLAAFLLLLVIKRGRAYIDLSEAGKQEVEKVIDTVTKINDELAKNFERTHKRIEDVAETNVMVEDKSVAMQADSKLIIEGVEDTVSTCAGAQDTIKVAKQQMSNLNQNIRYFEDALKMNESNISDIADELKDVKESTKSTEEVFEIFRTQMDKIIEVMDEMKRIASSTTMLALNASIEAARAGEAGKGFSVVAGKVQDLAISSTKCSAEVDEVVASMQEQINTTLEQMKTNVENVDSTITTLSELNASFEELTSKFDDLYADIEGQNSSMEAIEKDFDRVSVKIAEVDSSVKQNQESTDAIAQSIKVYGDNMLLMENDTKDLKVLVESMQDNLKV